MRKQRVLAVVLGCLWLGGCLGMPLRFAVAQSSFPAYAAVEPGTAKAAPAGNPPPRLPDMDVFTSGTGGYHSYRIPAIVRTPQGVLLAFCEARKDSRGDAGNIDLILRRSTDDGETWSATQVIWDDGVNTCGNPCPVIDDKTGRVWLLLTWNLGSDDEREIMAGTSRDVRRVYIAHSDDQGLTWTEPTPISDQTRQPHWRWYATGPGNAIQLTRGPHAGRLLIPANHSDHSDNTLHPFRSHVFWSDDHGQTWQLGGVQPQRTNESAVVELSDGSVLQSMRSYHGRHNRAMAVSRDGGKSWGDLYLEDALPTPVCQGNILRYSWPDDKRLGGKSRILFSSPSGKSRTALAVRLSYDEGKTWPTGKVIHSGEAAYSNLVVLADGRIGVLFEKDGYRTISLANFTLEWLTDGQDRVPPTSE
jgi:sialidase-1